MPKVDVDYEKPRTVVAEINRLMKVAAHDVKGIELSGYSCDRVSACADTVFAIWEILSSWRSAEWDRKRVERDVRTTRTVHPIVLPAQVPQLRLSYDPKESTGT